MDATNGDPVSASRRTSDVVAEIATPLVTVTLAFTMMRLFADWSLLADLVVIAVAAHLCAATLRWRGVPAGISSVLSALVGVLVVSWVVVPVGLQLGIPSGATLDAARDAVATSFENFRTLVAPVNPSPGFALTLGFGLWIVGSFSDVGSFRGRASVQAIIPHVATFVATSIFAIGRGAAWSTVAMALAVAAHIGAHRVARIGGERWMPNTRAPAIRTLLAGAGVIALGGAVLTAAIGPLLTTTRNDALVDLRSLGRADAPIEVGNPLVGVGNLLGPQSDVVQFEVRSDARHYWRTTALETYDPADQQWKTRRTYGDTDPDSELPGSPRAGTEITVDVSLKSLAGIWLPAPYRPTQVSSDEALRFDPDSAGIILSGESELGSFEYRVTSRVPPADVAGQTGPVDVSGVDDGYLESPELGTVADQWLKRTLRGVANDPLAQLRAVQDRFRNEFTYSTEVDYSTSPDAVGEFLSEGEGFCQQFASTMAQMARSLGLPSRIGVGFQWGDATEDAAGDTVYVVRGRNAHAWPEVYLGEELGWIAFEPTPGRGNPDTEAATGVPEQQPGVPGAAPTSTAAPTTTLATTPGGGTVVGATTTTVPSTAPATPTADGSQRGSGRWWWLGSVLVLVVVGGVVERWTRPSRRRARRRRHARGHSDQVGVAWLEVTEALRGDGVDITDALTPSEVAERTDSLGPGLNRLAELETRRRYAGVDLTAEEAEWSLAFAGQARTTATTTLSEPPGQ